MDRGEWWRVHLQWFADPAPAPAAEAEEPDQEDEIIYLEEGQQPPAEPKADEESAAEPERVVMTAEEWQQRQQSLIDATLKGVQSQAKSQPPAPAAPVPQQQPGESDADFRKRFKEELYNADDPLALVQQVVQRSVGPAFAGLNSTVVNQERELLLLKNPSAAKYATEIDNLVATVPAAQRQPGIYNQALNMVLQQHQEEIIEERVAARLAEQKKDEPKPEPKPATKPPAFSEGSSAAPRPKRQIHITREQRAAYERRADELGVDVDDLIRSEHRR